MSASIRLAEPNKDFAKIAELLTYAEAEPTSEADLHEDEARRVPGKFRQRLVAVNEQDEVVGYAAAVHYPSQATGLFHLIVVVAPAHQRQGIGTRLYERLLEFTQGYEATVLATEIMEKFPHALAAAEKVGFHVYRHALNATLDLTSFDERPFAGLLEEVEAQGIRLFSFADVGNTPENQQKLYEINRIAAIDDPASLSRTFPAYDVWLRMIPNSSGFEPAGQLLAADGDKFVGLSGISYDEDEGVARTLLSGIHPDYRGRKLVQALKLLAIRYAQACGAKQILTETDERNAPMMAVNRKLGFQSEPGYYALRKDLWASGHPPPPGA